MSGTVAIWNPASGGVGDESDLRAALGDEIELVPTTEDDPGPGQTRAAVANGANIVVSLAATLSAGGGVCRGERRRIDFGRVNGEAFAVMAGSGFDALMISDANDTLKSTVEIYEFEAKLVKSRTTIVKCMLHISFDEQCERFLRRLRRDDKRWKFSEADLETRRYWNAFQTAYGNTIARTTSDTAPWYVIPADHKWYRNWTIAKLLLATFDSMGATYPQPDLGLNDLRSRLAPPN